MSLVSFVVEMIGYIVRIGIVGFLSNFLCSLSSFCPYFIKMSYVTQHYSTICNHNQPQHEYYRHCFHSKCRLQPYVSKICVFPARRALFLFSFFFILLFVIQPDLIFLKFGFNAFVFKHKWNEIQISWKPLPIHALSLNFLLFFWVFRTSSTDIFLYK